MNNTRHEWTLKACLVLALVAALLAPARADEQSMLQRAHDAATASLETALPRLGAKLFGVDVAAYRDALTLGRFVSDVWGGTVTVDTVIRDTASGSCTRFAAFVRIPPENGAVSLVLCPQFFSAGADALRALTILHEMVHVVAGPDECQAMAFAARIEQAAKGRFTPVHAYWQANGCTSTQYRLPE